MKHGQDIPDHPAFEEERRRGKALDEEKKLERPIRRDALTAQALLFLLVLLLWPLPIINPIKLLVVLIHEISHVVAAYATGGVVFGIVIDPGGAGATLGIDGSPLIIAMAGYTGSLLVGIVLYMLVARWEPLEVWVVVCAMCGLSLALGWLDKFAMVFGVGAMILMLFGLFFSARIKLFLLRWTATTCCLYPIIDVLGEVWKHGDLGLKVNGRDVGSDVGEIARLLGVPSWAVGGAWIALGIIAVGTMAVWSANHEARREVRLSMRNKFRPRDYAQALYYGDKFNPPRYEIK